jgi:hypothetical protein
MAAWSPFKNSWIVRKIISLHLVKESIKARVASFLVVELLKVGGRISIFPEAASDHL